MRKEHANYTNHHTNTANIRYHWDSLKSQSVQRMFSEEAFKAITELPDECCYIKVSILPDNLIDRQRDLRLLNWEEISCYKDTVYPSCKTYPYSIRNTKTEYFFKKHKDALLFFNAHNGGQFYSSYRWSRLPE